MKGGQRSKLTPNGRDQTVRTDSQCLDLLLRLYEDDRRFAQHHEIQRTNGSGIVVAISAALLGLVSYDQKINGSDIPSAILICSLGLFGIMFAQKHYERTRLHLFRAYGYLDEISLIYPELQLKELRREATKKSDSRFPVISRFKLYKMWAALHGIVILAGALVLWKALGF